MNKNRYVIIGCSAAGMAVADSIRKHYDLIAGYLGVADPDSTTLSFMRKNETKGAEPKKSNVVLVFLESFAYYKTSMSGNPLDPTPHVAAMAKNAIIFPRFYTPHGGTARSVFTAVTGVSGKHQYIWSLVKSGGGNATSVRVAANCAAAISLQATSTAGVLDDAHTYPVMGVVLGTAQGASAGTNATAQVNYPRYLDVPAS